MSRVEGLILSPEGEPRAAVLDGHDLGGVMVTMSDLMNAGHCVRGIRRWFEEQGMDWRPLLRGGVSAVDLVYTEDALILAAIRLKLSRT